MLLKFCQRCLNAKTTDQFYLNRAHVDQLCTYCNQCDREMCAARRAENQKRKPITAASLYQECRGCEEILPLVAFAIDRSRPVGHARLCRDCAAQAYRDRVAKFAALHRFPLQIVPAAAQTNVESGSSTV